MASPDAVVVGAGVIGSAVAYALSREGMSVVLVERDRIAAHASRAAAGMLAPRTESLADPDGQRELRVLGLRSLELLGPLVDEIRDLSGIDPGYERCGVLRACRADEVAAFRKAAEQLSGEGCRWLDANEARALEERLHPEVAGAVWSEADGRVDAALLTRAFAAAAARLGTSFDLGSEVIGLVREGTRVVGVQTNDALWSTGEVVLCTGAWSRFAGAWAGLRVPVEPVRGQIVALEPPAAPLAGIVWGRDAYVVPRADGSVLVGATVERAGFDVRTTAGGIGFLLEAARELLPQLGDCGFRDAWAGLRPGTPDGRALVGPAPGVEGLTLATGHYRNGILLAPITALGVAEQLVGRAPAALLHAFDPGRFASVD